ncbi:MAG: hypothetical protein HY962_09850 [Ignavibacteriae bacterium]|nr:hypothetical protein [Ignavibacteriota bacterium]
MKRILLAALLGGLVMFVWTSVNHMLLPTAEMGVRSMPNEDPVIEALRNNVPEPGMYYFPGFDLGEKMTPEQEAAWTQKHKTGPAGLLIYKPVGGEPMPPMMLVTEFVSTILAALFMALIAARLSGAYMKRVLLLSLLGLFGWVSISLSQWNWYSFPTAYFIADGIDQFVGAIVGALLVAKLVPETSRA